MTEDKEDPIKSTVASAGDQTPEDNKPAFKRTLSRRVSLRGSLYRLKSLVFRKSDGEKGADIETLRGSHGAEYEGRAIIKRSGGVGVSCGCFGGDDESNEKIILIKGAYCFIFAAESDPTPKYAIALAYMKAKIQSPSHGTHKVTIETSLGDAEWELGFEEKQSAKKFVDVFQKQAVAGATNEARKRLGHDKPNRRSSDVFAEKIAQKKMLEQPEKKENVLLEDANGMDPMSSAC